MVFISTDEDPRPPDPLPAPEPPPADLGEGVGVDQTPTDEDPPDIVVTGALNIESLQVLQTSALLDIDEEFDRRFHLLAQLYAPPTVVTPPIAIDLTQDYGMLELAARLKPSIDFLNTARGIIFIQDYEILRWEAEKERTKVKEFQTAQELLSYAVTTEWISIELTI